MAKYLAAVAYHHIQLLNNTIEFLQALKYEQDKDILKLESIQNGYR